MLAVRHPQVGPHQRRVIPLESVQARADGRERSRELGACTGIDDDAVHRSMALEEPIVVERPRCGRTAEGPFCGNELSGQAAPRRSGKRRRRPAREALERTRQPIKLDQGIRLHGRDHQPGSASVVTVHGD